MGLQKADVYQMRWKVVGQDPANKISRVLIINVNFDLFIFLDFEALAGRVNTLTSYQVKSE